LGPLSSLLLKERGGPSSGKKKKGKIATLSRRADSSQKKKGEKDILFLSGKGRGRKEGSDTTSEL